MDPVRIAIPKGGYMPTFHTVQNLQAGAKTSASGNRNDTLSSGPTVAVMPLVNLTGDAGQDYFADGLTEELTTELARCQDVRVIATHSTMRFKGQEIDPTEVARDLGAQFLLRGSVRKDPKTFKVSIGLLDTSTLEEIWACDYRRHQTPADLIALQEEIAQNAIGAVADHYGYINRRMSRESAKKVPADLKAYDATLRFYHYETELTPEAFEQALTALEHAIDIDPEYGLAWAMLGHLYADNHALGFREIKTPLKKALKFARKGMALEPENQFISDSLTLVYFHQGDKDAFLRQLEQTVALNPNSPYIIGVAGWHLVLYGEWERGLALLERGMILNPYFPSWFHLAIYMNYYRLEDWENAFAEAMKFNYPDLFWDPLIRAAALGQMGRKLEAETVVGELLEVAPDFAVRGRRLISNYVKVDDLADKIIEGLKKAGLDNLDQDG